MKIAFLVMAHAWPGQLGTLCSRLTEYGDDCFVHLDQKAEITTFRDAVKGIPNLTFIDDRFELWWGGWGFVEAAASLVRAALKSSTAQRLCLISGACYPCRPLSELRIHLDSDREFMGIREVKEGDKKWARYSQYHLWDADLLNPRGSSRRASLAAGSDYIRQFLRDTNCQPPKLEHPVFSGPTWWALSRAAASSLVERFDETDYWRQRFRYTQMPDEGVFPTIMGTGPYAAKCAPNLHYVDWNTIPRPKTLDADDLPAVNASGKYFARKIDPVVSASLVEALDRRIDLREPRT